MRRFPIKRPSPALVVACIALIVALSGTGYAAVVLPRGSVGTIQLKNAAVTSPKVKDSSITSLDIAPATRASLKGQAGAPSTRETRATEATRVTRAPPGDKGATGAAGAPGISGYAIVEKTATATSPSQAVWVRCTAGMRALGGGGDESRRRAPVSRFATRFLCPACRASNIVAEAKSPGTGWSYRVQAVCANVAQ